METRALFKLKKDLYAILDIGECFFELPEIGNVLPFLRRVTGLKEWRKSTILRCKETNFISYLF